MEESATPIRKEFNIMLKQRATVILKKCTILDKPVFIKEENEKKLFSVPAVLVRKSGKEDHFTLLFYDDVENFEKLEAGKEFSIYGNLRKNVVSGDRLVVYIHCISIKENHVSSNLFDNRASVSGFITKEPKLRELSNGRKILTVNIRSRYNDEKIYLNLVAWDGLAESFANTIHSGEEILVVGRLESRKNKDNEEFYEFAMAHVYYIDPETKKTVNIRHKETAELNTEEKELDENEE